MKYRRIISAWDIRAYSKSSLNPSFKASTHSHTVFKYIYIFFFSRNDPGTIAHFLNKIEK